MNEDDELMTTRDVAKMFHVTTYTVRQWISSGKLRSYAINGRHRVRRVDALNLLKQRTGYP